MLSDNNVQKPWSKNQIQNEKPNAPSTMSLLSGYIANSFNAGHNRAIAWKKVMAGEKHREYKIKLKIRTLTPLTPAYQNLKCTIRSYFVPNSRVWKNAEKYFAQKGGATVEKVAEIPNTRGKNVPVLPSTDGSTYISYMHTTTWRDSWFAPYIPRMGQAMAVEMDAIERIEHVMPAMSILPLRGRIAIYNDFERNKEYDTEWTEYNTDQVSDAEWNYYMGYTNGVLNRFIDEQYMRAKREDSYYTDLRSEAQSTTSNIYEEMADLSDMTSFVEWSNIENKIAELRSQAENAQLNDWDIIAKLRGSKLLTEGKVQLIGQHTFNLNYASITQNTYNNNNQVREEFTVMGQQGAYSYTETVVPCYAGMVFNEEGYVHIIATVSADSVFETAFDRNLLNITPFDEYRPDLLNQKYDIMYQVENGTAREPEDLDFYKAVGFKRKFNEYFKLPNTICGDLCTQWYFTTSSGDQGNYLPANDEYVITNSTYQFFETDRDFEVHEVHDGLIFRKYFWKDYSDFLVNKNQAIKNTLSLQDIHINDCFILGNNQIDLVGRSYCIADLPVDESIKHNYTTWGEH